MLTETVIIVGGKDLSDTCENEQVNAFIGHNIKTRQNLTSYAQVSWKCTLAAFYAKKHVPQAVFWSAS